MHALALTSTPAFHYILTECLRRVRRNFSVNVGLVESV